MVVSSFLSHAYALVKDQESVAGALVVVQGGPMAAATVTGGPAPLGRRQTMAVVLSLSSEWRQPAG